MSNKLSEQVPKTEINNDDLCFEKLKELSPNKSPLVLIKKEDYALIKISKVNPFVKRMLKITNNEKDTSEKFIILYIRKKFIGYKGINGTRFIQDFEEEYKNILKEYIPKSERKKNIVKTQWNINNNHNNSRYR